MKLLKINNKIINLKSAFESLANAGHISYADIHVAYRMLAGKELTKEQVHLVLDSLSKAVDELLILPPPHSSDQNGFEESEPRMDFEQFCCTMPQLLISNVYNTSPLNWSNILSFKTTQFVQSLSYSLSKLLENTPNLNDCGPGQPTTQLDSDENHRKCDVYFQGVDNSAVVSTLREKGLTVNDSVEFSERCPSSQSVDSDLQGAEKCQVIFVCISGTTRAVEEMVKAAYYFGTPSLSGKVVVYLQYLEDDCIINGEKLSKIGVKDYNRGRSYLTDMARRENIPVFDDLSAAMDSVMSLCKKS